MRTTRSLRIDCAIGGEITFDWRDVVAVRSAKVGMGICFSTHHVELIFSSGYSAIVYHPDGSDALRREFCESRKIEVIEPEVYPT